MTTQTPSLFAAANSQHFDHPPTPAVEPVPSRFRFKSSSKQNDAYGTSHKRQKVDDSSDAPPRRRRHHHGHHRRKASSPPQESATLDAEAAFRESLFDAMADDEGAHFWSEVYGQPIAGYDRTTRDTPDAARREMNDEEYVAHVRARMWEKTHEAAVEERTRRKEAARKRGEERTRSARESEAAGFGKMMEESLRQGERRKEAKRARETWSQYEKAWGTMLAGESMKSSADSACIPWPVRSGRVMDVSKESVRSFFDSAPAEGDGWTALRGRLKIERIRWHPDKMQQRFGAVRMDEKTLRTVTAVFQYVDEYWTELRNSK